MPDLMELILRDLPGYVYDPNMQRVEWLNSLVASIWTPVTNAVEVELRKVSGSVGSDEINEDR